VTASTQPRGGEETLLGHIHRARDLPEALSIFFDAVLNPAGVQRAVVLIDERQELRGVLGMGWETSAARGLSVSLYPDSFHPLAEAYRAGRAVRVDLEADVLGEAGSFTAIPMPGAGDRDCGLLVIGPADRAPSSYGGIIAALAEAGPAIDRISELDRLRRVSREHEQQRDLLTSIVNALPDPVLITDTENSVMLENRRAESLFTTSEGDSDGRRRAVEINNLLFSSFLTKSTFTTLDAPSRELNLVDPSEGFDLLFEVLTTALPPSAAGNKAMVSVLRDVTDLKRATGELEAQFQRLRHTEHTARRERDRLNMILENVGDPILVTDDQSNIILMNREAERLFDVPAGTDLKSRRRAGVRANDTKFSSFISDFALSSDTARIAQFELSEPETGRTFPAEVVTGKVLNDRNEMAAIISVLHDLTKVVENERLAGELTKLNENLENRITDATEALEERNRQLEWQSRELERAYRLKSQFLASMSHELRTPINALMGYTSLMQDQIYGELNTRQEEALSRMNAASQHLLELINDILDLAKIEAGKMPVHVESVDVAQLIRELGQTIEPMIRRKKLEYRVELDDDVASIETDRTKVKQIILNLLSNAVKFTREGHIAVRAHAADDGVIIEVADSGIGITEEDIQKIFEDFRQVDQSSTREYGGTGLGLSITKKLLHLLGGTVRVESSIGEGSTFIVSLPRRSEEIVLDEDIARMAREADSAVVRNDESRTADHG
jgi:PAS domain S-box-containing protein